MLSFAGSLKVFMAAEPCDRRKGFNARRGWGPKSSRKIRGKGLYSSSAPLWPHAISINVAVSAKQPNIVKCSVAGSGTS
jgi:hypothetical protein